MSFVGKRDTQRTTQPANDFCINWQLGEPKYELHLLRMQIHALALHPNNELIVVSPDSTAWGKILLAQWSYQITHFLCNLCFHRTILYCKLFLARTTKQASICLIFLSALKLLYARSKM